MTFDPRNPEVVVTVVMIFLNGEKYLEEAIRSVLGQTFTGWELMLINDGSIDRSSDIAQKYAAAWPQKIRYLEHPGHQNRGMSASRNLGIRSGRGKYIAFLDCDDVWHSEKLARQIEILDQYPEAGMVYSATIRWFGWTGRPEDAANDQPRPLGIVPGRLVCPPEMIPRFLRDEGKTPAICSVLIRREAVESVGAFEESFRSLYEDQAFFYKFFLRHAVFVQSGHWDWYRQHPESCCHIASGGRMLTALHPAFGRFLDWFEHYLATTPVYDQSVNIALKWARRPFCQPRRYRVERALARGWGRAQNLARRVARKILPGVCS